MSEFNGIAFNNDDSCWKYESKENSKEKWVAYIIKLCYAFNRQFETILT